MRDIAGLPAAVVSVVSTKKYKNYLNKYFSLLSIISMWIILIIPQIYRYNHLHGENGHDLQRVVIKRQTKTPCIIDHLY